MNIVQMRRGMGVGIDIEFLPYVEFSSFVHILDSTDFGEWSIKMAIKSYTKWSVFVGLVNGNSWAPRFYMNTTTTSVDFTAGGSNYGLKSGNVINPYYGFHVYNVNMVTGVAKIDGTQITRVTPRALDANSYLGARGNVEYIQTWTSGILEHDFRACRYNGVDGVFDIIGKKFIQAT